ncbi:Imm53 family immunity protein [Providencia manganoxydans]|uniref:Immunity 53 family protein n=1 Tax=Providencia manganoxydans TaxID=2923283 RepID=A0ABX7ACH4_9GAMM|nr:immunity 53 family protein [Providencia manganoxydans]
MNDDLITQLQNWYKSKCNGLWEHEYGLDISTLDNPGWKVHINGEKGKEELNLTVNNNDDDWLNIITNDIEFKGYGSPQNLNTILNYAIKWLNKPRQKI